MRNKKILALSLATTMLLGSSLSVAAVDGTAVDSSGTTITGQGNTAYVDTEIYRVTIPTTETLSLLNIDPQGIMSMPGATATAEELAAYAGKITSTSKPMINNTSSKPMKVTVALQVTGNATTVTSETAVEADKSNNILLYAVPSATDVAGSEGNYTSSTTGIVMKSDAPVSVDFILPAATYNFKRAGEGASATYSYELADEGHGTALSFEGLVNKKADWTDYKAGGSKSIGMTAKFTFTNEIGSDEADDAEGAPYAMKAYVGDKVTLPTEGAIILLNEAFWVGPDKNDNAATFDDGAAISNVKVNGVACTHTVTDNYIVISWDNIVSIGEDDVTTWVITATVNGTNYTATYSLN